MLVTSLGDRAEPACITRGVLRRDQAQILHQSFGVCKARQIPDLCDERDCCDEVDAAQTHHCVDYTLHAPVLTLLAQSLGEPLEPFVGVADGLAYTVESILVNDLILGRT